MKLIIGLGNPGGKYRNNRHNTGFMFVDWAKEEDFFSKEVFLVKTDCFMNASGKFVKKMVTSHSSLVTGDLYVAHDDLDLPLGKYKIQFGKGPKIHNGVNSVEQELGTTEFWRIRIGVDARDPNSRTPGDEYVLQDFSDDELETLKGVFDEIIRSDPFKQAVN